jgi:hypothetical protein
MGNNSCEIWTHFHELNLLQETQSSNSAGLEWALHVLWNEA